MSQHDKRIEATLKVRQIAMDIAEKDTTRPRYHFHAPAQWGDDPSGYCFFKGYYHMMYGSNPDSWKVGSGMPYRTENNKWAPEEPEYFDAVALWGHARSKDLVHWEHMPYVCYPDIEHDEYFIWWGCTTINDDGVPVIIYTSLGRRRGPDDGAEQRMLICNDRDSLTDWNHYKENPILKNSIHGDLFVYQWRDPFVFKDHGKSYMVLGGKLPEEKGGECVVLLYEAVSGDYTEWKYKNIFFTYPQDKRKSMECPLVAKIDGKWVLIVSPHGPVEYFVGDIDFERGVFEYQKRGFVDQGKAFYAPNIAFDDKGRCIMFAAVEGFEATQGWNGVQCVPRILNIAEDGTLLEKIPEEIAALRKESISLKEGSSIAKNGTFELEAVFSSEADLEIIIEYDVKQVKLAYHRSKFTINDQEVMINSNNGTVSLQLFFDVSVVDTIMNNTESLVVIVPPCTTDCKIEARCSDQEAVINCWQYETDGLFTYSKIDY